MTYVELRRRLELRTQGYKSSILPLNYRSRLVAGGGFEHQMLPLHYPAVWSREEESNLLASGS